MPCLAQEPDTDELLAESSLAPLVGMVLDLPATTDPSDREVGATNHVALSVVARAPRSWASWVAV